MTSSLPTSPRATDPARSPTPPVVQPVVQAAAQSTAAPALTSTPAVGAAPGQGDAADQPGPDALALQRVRQRMAGAAQAPWLHEEVGRRLADKLLDIRLTPGSWIDWSAWLGASGAHVRDRYPQAQHWIVEPDGTLAHRSRQQLGAQWPAWRRWWSRPPEQVHVAASLNTSPWQSQGVDLLWANMSLHGSDDLGALLRSWHRQLAVDGFLMCSGLGPDTARELRGIYAREGWGLPGVPLVDMHDIGDELVRSGFADPVVDMERIRLTWPHAQAMLDELRSWGGNVARGRFAGLRTPAWRQRLLRCIEEQCRDEQGRVGLTVEVIYGHAIKPATKHLLSPQTQVSLQDMRQMLRSGSGKKSGDAGA